LPFARSEVVDSGPSCKARAEQEKRTPDCAIFLTSEASRDRIEGIAVLSNGNACSYLMQNFERVVNRHALWSHDENECWTPFVLSTPTESTSCRLGRGRREWKQGWQDWGESKTGYSGLAHHPFLEIARGLKFRETYPTRYPVLLKKKTTNNFPRPTQCTTRIQETWL
jgi:hypothetical protein